MVTDFNNRLRQVFFLTILVAGAILLFNQLYVFFPGFLGALTLYILAREPYDYLTTKRKWNKSLAAALFLILFLICVAAPVYMCFQMFYSKVETLIKNPEPVTQGAKRLLAQIQDWTGMDLMAMDIGKSISQKLGNVVPKLLNSSATMLANLLMILFLAFFMFTNGSKLESGIGHFVPLKKKNLDLLSHEIVMMVKANAVGIPVVSLLQGAVALLGYWIFGVKDFVLLGFVTGIFAFFPVVGTAVVWLPIVISFFASDENGKAIGLGLYSLVVTGNIDYLARVTLLKKVGDVHPVTTILGLIVGLKLFGFWGFIFGPLLISTFMLLVKIYKNEFTAAQRTEAKAGKST